MLKPIRSSAAIATGLVAIGLAACGGDSGGDATAAGATTTDATTQSGALAEHAVPADLVGTYSAHRPAGAFPAGTWKLAIGPRGEFFIAPPGETGFFDTPISATNSEIKLSPNLKAGCGQPGTYSYELKGSIPGGTLELSSDSETCPDRSAVLEGTFKRTG